MPVCKLKPEEIPGTLEFFFKNYNGYEIFCWQQTMLCLSAYNRFGDNGLAQISVFLTESGYFDAGKIRELCAVMHKKCELKRLTQDAIEFNQLFEATKRLNLGIF